MQAIPIDRQNKYYVAPGPTQPPTGHKTRDVPDAPASQMTFVPKETPGRQVREPLVALGQVLTQEEGLTTSRDIIVRNLKKADAS